MNLFPKCIVTASPQNFDIFSFCLFLDISKAYFADKLSCSVSKWQWASNWEFDASLITQESDKPTFLPLFPKSKKLEYILASNQQLVGEIPLPDLLTGYSAEETGSTAEGMDITDKNTRWQMQVMESDVMICLDAKYRVSSAERPIGDFPLSLITDHHSLHPGYVWIQANAKTSQLKELELFCTKTEYENEEVDCVSPYLVINYFHHMILYRSAFLTLDTYNKFQDLVIPDESGGHANDADGKNTNSLCNQHGFLPPREVSGIALAVENERMSTVSEINVTRAEMGIKRLRAYPVIGTTNRNQYVKDCLKLGWIPDTDLDETAAEQLVVGKEGPAVHVMYINPGLDMMGNQYDILDMTVALPCQWPTLTKNWLKRERPSHWPTERMIKDIEKAGCHLVPKSYPDGGNDNLEWRLSFSVAERTLVRATTLVQRASYRIMKGLYRHTLKAHKGISSYHLKTVFLYKCEQIPSCMWTEDSIKERVLEMLQDLHNILMQQNAPNYFLPQNNMLSHISSDVIHTLLQKVQLLILNPSTLLWGKPNWEPSSIFSDLSRLRFPTCKSTIAHKLSKIAKACKMPPRGSSKSIDLFQANAFRKAKSIMMEVVNKELETIGADPITEANTITELGNSFIFPYYLCLKIMPTIGFLSQYTSK